MFYLIKTPWWLKKLYPSLIWNMPPDKKIIYLTFDDGPHPTSTSFILEQLTQFNAKATFFCIGENVVQLPEIYRRIIDDGHKPGNHTYNHLNAWKTDDKKYLKNVYEAAKIIDSDLFRPPYGKITNFQARLLQGENHQASIVNRQFKIIMWDVLSADFDEQVTPEQCLQNVILNTTAGSIIVFHDSTKAWKRMSFALSRVLEYFSRQGYSFKSLEV